MDVAMCGFCAEKLPKGQLQPSMSGGAKCKDWFGCAQRREAVIMAQAAEVFQNPQRRV